MILDYTLDQFINYNIYLGYSKNSNVPNAFCFISGLKNNLSIINLSYSIEALKKVFLYLSKFWVNFGTLLIVNFINRNLISELKGFSLELKFRLAFWLQQWKMGVLSNFKNLLLCPKLSFNKIIYPNSVFFLTLSLKPTIWKEALCVKIIPIFIMDTNVGIQKNGYSIPGNEKTLLSYFFFQKLLQNFIIRIFLLKKINFLKKK